MVRGERTRRAGRRSAARLRDIGAAGRVLWLAVVLYRRAPGSAARGSAARPRRARHGARRADPAAFGTARDRVLRWAAVPEGIPRRCIRDAAGVVEPCAPHRLQGGPAALRQRQTYRRVQTIFSPASWPPTKLYGPGRSASHSCRTGRCWSARTATARSGALPGVEHSGEHPTWPAVKLVFAVVL